MTGQQQAPDSFGIPGWLRRLFSRTIAALIASGAVAWFVNSSAERDAAMTEAAYLADQAKYHADLVQNQQSGALIFIAILLAVMVFLALGVYELLALGIYQLVRERPAPSN